MKPYSILILALFVSCNYKIVSFTSYNNHQKNEYRLKIEKGYVLRKASYESENVFVYEYPDSSRIFFSDNVHPSAFYPSAYDKYGKDINLKFMVNDTLSIEGVDSIGRYWKNIKLSNIVYGYTQVLIQNKDKFDTVLSHIQTKRHY